MRVRVGHLHTLDEGGGRLSKRRVVIGRAEVAHLGLAVVAHHGVVSVQVAVGDVQAV